jgi:hypothetical protein
MFGFKKKKKGNTLPVPKKKLTKDDIQQRRLEMAAELQELDFKAEKAKRQSQKRINEAGARRAKIEGIFDTIDTSLSFVSDKPLKNPAGTETKRKRPSSLDDPFGDSSWV